MQTYKVWLQQTRCAQIEIEAENEDEARHKALEETANHPWCEGDSVEITDMDLVLSDDDK